VRGAPIGLWCACLRWRRPCNDCEKQRPGAILLGEVAAHLTAVAISLCNLCPRRVKSSIGRLRQEHGPDMPVPELLRLLSVAPTRPGR
jgi:hypothetical protein